MFGAGGRANMSPALRESTNSIIAKEYEFLNDFAVDIASGNVSEAQSRARVKQYGNASQQSYWQALIATGGALAIIDSNPLYTVPGAGATRCRGNCKCTLNFLASGLIVWKLNPAEHCPDCLDLANRSPYTSLRF